MQVTIVGLGLIGSSMGQALKRKHGSKITVVGYDSDQSVHDNAVKIGAADRSEWNLDQAVRDSDVVIIATPANAVYDIFEAISSYLGHDAIVIDTSATKRAVMDWAEELLPERNGYVGIDPLAGSGYRGQKDAHPTLFEGQRVALIPSVRTPENAIKTASKIIEDIGGRPFFMDVDEHDSFSAAVTGLPSVVAAAMLSVASASPSWREISRFVGSDFQAVTEPASQDPATSHATAVTNPDMTIHWIDQLIGALTVIRDGVADDETRYDADSPMVEIFVNAWEQRIRIEAGIEPGGNDTENALPTAGESMMTMMLGRLGERLVSRSKIQEKDPTKYDRRRLR